MAVGLIGHVKDVSWYWACRTMLTEKILDKRLNEGQTLFKDAGREIRGVRPGVSMEQ